MRVKAAVAVTKSSKRRQEGPCGSLVDESEGCYQQLGGQH